MSRITSFGIVLFLVGGHTLQAVNPHDIEFRALLVKTSHVYHMGEPIDVQISYSSQIEKKYLGSFWGPSPDVVGVTPNVTPMDGVLDLRPLRAVNIGAGSILSGVGYVGPQPITEQLDLCEWYRFQRPGRYSVVVTSTQVSWTKSVEEGGGLEHLTLESNPLDFEILPAGPAWEAAQISSIEEKLNATTDAGERGVSLRRLALLDTPASLQLLVKLYLATPYDGEDWIFDLAMHVSSRPDIIISLLTSAISHPAANIPQNLPRLLADLQTRRQLGLMPPYPSDSASREKWVEEWKARSNVHDTYVAQADALMKASIEKRSGSRRAVAIYQVWYDAMMPGRKPLPPEDLLNLQSKVLAVASELGHQRQVQFVILAWQTMPHEQLHSLVRELAENSMRHSHGYIDLEPIRLWCAGWPGECNATILQGIKQTDAKVDKNVILMIVEAEHPELDSMLETQLQEPTLLADAFQSQRVAAAVLRAGSGNLAPVVDSFLDQQATKGRCDGVTRGELLGYLFRVAPKDAGRRLSANLEGKNYSCGIEALRTLHETQLHPSEGIIPIVTEALNSSNLEVQRWAALYLADRGSGSSEEALWRRLEALWSEWRGRSSELQRATLVFGYDAKAQSALLEEALASALAHAKNWRLTPEEREHLRSGCLTQQCRDVADGKLFVNL